MRPPRPAPATRTVVSPPERRTHGAAAGWPRSATWRAIAACTPATSRDSPSTASLRINGRQPASRATAAAASSAACGVATTAKRLRARRASPGFGVSSAAAARRAATAGGGTMAYFSSTPRASAKVVGSGTVGPEAMVAGSSPGTSEIARVSTRAGHAAAASRPPLIAERCLRTQFISEIVAPERSRSPVTACLSASATPGAGTASSAEPPPEIRHRARSPSPSPRAASSMARAASSPARSGTGCAASTTRMRAVAQPWP